MINCPFADDKPLALDVLLNYAARMPAINVVLSTTDPLKALAKITEGGIDLVFLDIQMPELNGLQLIKLIAGKCQVVFTTAYAEHALECYELNATDYLLKPVSFERFYQAVEKATVVLKGLGDPIPSLANQPSTGNRATTYLSKQSTNCLG
ncbi:MULTISPECIES: LytR/AlgR family response regulator transcription factor [Mucilaginibacter]|uniref:LytR/AlgR family response regulator transcription factor n=1 Tax=Mucilaginibacter TaxID=423349 RepID=UPI0001E9D8D6|nr:MULTISPECIES: response regulator [Mucilaginibacter]